MKYVFVLYITERTSASTRALQNLRRIADTHLAGRYELTVVDVLRAPDIADKEKIIATPTLIKQFPPPVLRLVGDLSNEERIQQLFERLPYQEGAENVS